MTKMLKQKDSGGRWFRLIYQKSAVTCGPAACLIMWANVHDADPIADEGGVIALTKMFPKPWDPTTGASIVNLTSVLNNMAVPAVNETFSKMDDLRNAMVTRVKPKKPALCFMQWMSTAKTIGHFVVVSYAANDRCTVLDPHYGLQEMTSMPYKPQADDEDPPPVLKFTGNVTFVK